MEGFRLNFGKSFDWVRAKSRLVLPTCCSPRINKFLRFLDEFFFVQKEVILLYIRDILLYNV